jgi:hypothetical protein
MEERTIKRGRENKEVAGEKHARANAPKSLSIANQKRGNNERKHWESGKSK